MQLFLRVSNCSAKIPRVAESHSLASLKTGSHLDGKAALSFGYLTEQDEYVVMMRQDDGGYRRKSYPADGTGGV